MKYFTLFLILCVLVHAADDECDDDCTDCLISEDKCNNNKKTAYCQCCKEGYVQKSDKPRECTCGAAGYSKHSEQGCVKCDKHCTLASGCATQGEGKCDTACDPGYELKNNKCEEINCGVDKCEICENTTTCQVCKTGYKLESNKCTKNDCTKNQATHCDKCSGPEESATCYECQDGYEFDEFDGKCKDSLSHCTENLSCGKTKEHAYKENICYTIGGKYYKVDGNKKCKYSDKECSKRDQDDKEISIFDECIKVGDKYYKYDSCKPKEGAKEYSNSGCTENKKDVTEACVEDGSEFIKVKNSDHFTYYTDKACTKASRVDEECEPICGTGGSDGSVVNMIMLAILIISFMI